MPNKLKWGKIEMNILQLCKAAERYETLCRMKLNEHEIRKAAERYKIPFADLYFFIDSGVNDTEHLGTIFARYVAYKPHFIELVIINDDFYDIWECATNN